MARRHAQNRIVHANDTSRILLWKTVLEYFETQPVSGIDYFLIVHKYAKFKASSTGKSTFAEILSAVTENKRRFFKLLGL